MRPRALRPGRVLAALAAGAVGAVFLAPLLWMAAAALKPEAAIHADVDSLASFVPRPLTLANYVAAAERGRIGRVLLNTLAVVALIAGGGLVLNTAAAYALARMRFPGRGLLLAGLLATIIVPLEAIVIPLFVTVQHTRGLADRIGAVPWTLAALSVPFMAKAFNIYLLRQAFLGLPRALEEAAFLDGAGWWQTLVCIILPNLKPALVTVVLLDFVIHWNDFLWPLVICQDERTHTIQLGLSHFFTQPPIAWGPILAYAVLAALPLAVVFVAGQRWIVQSLAAHAVRE